MYYILCGRVCRTFTTNFKNLPKHTIKSNHRMYGSTSCPISGRTAKQDVQQDVKQNVKQDVKQVVKQGCNTSIPGKPSGFNRIVRQEPGPVRLGFIPDEWFTFFFKKTGVSGAGTFAFTVATYLISKELYVMEHEYYSGLSVAILCIVATKQLGPMIAQMIDKEIDKYEKGWTDGRQKEVTGIQNSIKHEEKLQWCADGQLMLVAAKRENVHLQREGAYRARIMTAYLETKKRLEYCLSRQAVEEAIVKRQMAEWVIAEVRKDITEKIQKDTMAKCFEDLKNLAKTLEGLKSGDKEVK